jgi:nucleotide-binding universal stress UspA family protein
VSYREILVGTDGSSTASQAVVTASRLAAALSVPLVIVTAWRRRQPDPPAPSEEATYPAGGGAAGAEATWATHTTSDAAAIARQEGVAEIRQLQPDGRAAETLLEVAAGHPEALLVVGTYGLADRTERLVGNVPHALTHHSPVDLLLSTGVREKPWETVALATDGSPTAARAVSRGLELANALGSHPTLLTAARDDARGEATLDRVADQLPATTGMERRVVVDSDAATALTSAAADFDLLAIGNKAMSGPSRLLGSVANRVTHQVPTDLLLVNTTR